MGLMDRLALLEQAFGTDIAAATPAQRAWQRFDNGAATLTDVAAIVEPDIRVHRSLLVVGAWMFGGTPEERWGLLHQPLQVGAAIVSTPPEATPRADLISQTTDWAHAPGMPDLGSEADPGFAFRRGRWLFSCIVLIALGAPDGFPLRSGMARGEFDDAADIVNETGLGIWVPLPMQQAGEFRSPDDHVTFELRTIPSASMT